MMRRIQQLATSFVVVVVVLAVVTAAPSTDTLHYAVSEEIAVGSVIADIVTDAGLHVYGVEVCTERESRHPRSLRLSVATSTWLQNYCKLGHGRRLRSHRRIRRQSS